MAARTFPVGAVTLLAALLAGCAAPPTPAQPGPVALVPQPPPPPALPTSASADTVLGTPFLWAIKIPACAASLLVSGPTAAAYTLADQGAIPPEQDWREDVNRAVDTYCGPPNEVPPPNAIPP